MKILKIIGLVFLSIIIGLILYLNIFIIGRCDKFNPVYFEWFPYHQGDELLFKNSLGEYKKLTIQRFTINHTASYFKNCKCGYCEDDIEIAFYGAKDSLIIIMRNLENPEGYFKGHDFLNSADEEGYYKLKDTLTNGKKYEFYETKNHKIIKHFGMVELKEDNEVFKIQKVVRKNKNRFINEKSVFGP
jgi:hypothetical protein